MSAVTILTGITVTLGEATITLGVAPLVQGAFWVSMGLVIMLRLLVGMMLTVIAVPTFYTTVYGIVNTGAQKISSTTSIGKHRMCLNTCSSCEVTTLMFR